MNEKNVISNLVDIVSILHKQVNEIEKSWDIIRTLSPQSVPPKNIDKELSLRDVNLFNSIIIQSKQYLDKAYNLCPYQDDDPICNLLSNCRYNIDILLQMSTKIISDNVD